MTTAFSEKNPPSMYFPSRPAHFFHLPHSHPLLLQPSWQFLPPTPPPPLPLEKDDLDFLNSFSFLDDNNDSTPFYTPPVISKPLPQPPPPPPPPPPRLKPPPKHPTLLHSSQDVWALKLVYSASIDSKSKEDRQFASYTAAQGIEIVHVPGSRLSNERVESLLNLTRRNMEGMYQKANDHQFVWCDRKKRRVLRSDQMQFLLAQQDKSSSLVLGFAAFTFTVELEIPHMYLHELQVEPNKQNLGVGSLLVQRLCAICKECQIPLMLLTVFTHNEAALRFYGKHGFVVDEMSPSRFAYVHDKKASYELLSKRLESSVNFFSCTECEFKCRFKDSLVQHTCECHNGKWPLHCEQCFAGMQNEKQLSLHQRHMHMLPSGVERLANTTPTTTTLSTNLCFTRVRLATPPHLSGVIIKVDKKRVEIRLDGEARKVISSRICELEGHEKSPKRSASTSSSEDSDDSEEEVIPETKHRQRGRPLRKRIISCSDESD